MFVVTFTRHKLTTAQLAEIGSVDADFMDLASLNILTEVQGEGIFLQIAERCKGKGDVNIFGVLPVPLRACFVAHNETDPDYALPHIQVWEAFNVNRSPEGQKPTFEHVAWLRTGSYNIREFAK